jgi:ubiquinone/menaquinone biosynthesis C-methylase UbiE
MHLPWLRRATHPPVSRLRQWAVELLHVQPADRVLEFGFGPDLALRDTAAHLTSGCVVGIDPTGTRLDVVHVRHAPAVPDSKVHVLQGMGQALPLAAASFDKALTIDVIDFMPDPLALLREVLRVLRPGGRVAVFWLPGASPARQGRAAEVFRPYEPVEVIELLLAAGFEGPWIRTSYFGWGEGRCAQATKPAGRS